MYRTAEHTRVAGSTFPWFLAAAGLAAVILATGYVLRNLTGVDGSVLYRDANAIAGQPFYYGLLESMTASILLMSGAILVFETLHHRRSSALRPFLAVLALGLLTILLGLDDLVMIHESAPYLDISPETILGAYAIVLLAALVLDPAEMLQPGTVLPVLALLSLGVAGTCWASSRSASASRNISRSSGLRSGVSTFLRAPSRRSDASFVRQRRGCGTPRCAGERSAISTLRRAAILQEEDAVERRCAITGTVFCLWSVPIASIKTHDRERFRARRVGSPKTTRWSG